MYEKIPQERDVLHNIPTDSRNLGREENGQKPREACETDCDSAPVTSHQPMHRNLSLGSRLIAAGPGK